MPPYLLLLLFVGAIYGTLFHLLQGQTLLDLAFYIVVGIIGSAIGQLVGQILALDLFAIGILRITEVTALAWLCLLAARWLKTIKIKPNPDQSGE